MIFLFFSLNNISSVDVKRLGVKSIGLEGSVSINNFVIFVDYKSFKVTWIEVVYINRERWRVKVFKGNMFSGYFLGDLFKLFSIYFKIRFCYF